MVREDEASFTPEQAVLLGIDPLRQSWRERMMQRTILALKWAGVGALAGGIAVPLGTSLFLEGFFRLAVAVGQIPQDENLFQFVRKAPFYVAPLTALYGAFHMGLIMSFRGGSLSGS